MDAEFVYELANNRKKRVPAARVVISSPQFATQGVTNVGISSIAAPVDSLTASVTTVSAHGLTEGEFVSVTEVTTDESIIAFITGDGTDSVSTVSTYAPHGLAEGIPLTIAGNSVTLTGATVSGLDGATAQVTTSTPHGLGTEATITVGSGGTVTSSIATIVGDGTNAYVTTLTPHTFAVGESVLISTQITNSISFITGNGTHATVNAPNTFAVGDSVTISGNVLSFATSVTDSPSTVTSDSATPGVTSQIGVQLTVTAPTIWAGASSGTISGLQSKGQIRSIGGTGNVGEVVTIEEHFLSVGSTVTILVYDNRFDVVGAVVQSVLSPNRFTYTTPHTFASNVSLVYPGLPTLPYVFSGLSGANGSWTFGHSGKYVVFTSPTAGPYSSGGTQPNWVAGVVQGSSAYNGTHTVTAATSSSFTFASTATLRGIGGQYNANSSYNGTQTVISVGDSGTGAGSGSELNFAFASTNTTGATAGFTNGPSGFNATNVTITIVDTTNFTYACTALSGSTSIVNAVVTGLTAFNGSYDTITYVDAYTFSLNSNNDGTGTGGSITAASGFNIASTEVLSVPSSTTFTYACPEANVAVSGGTTLVSGNTYVSGYAISGIGGAYELSVITGYGTYAVATVTPTNNDFTPGLPVVIAGATPSELNGTWETIVGSTSGEIWFDNPLDAGTNMTVGTVTLGNGPVFYGLNELLVNWTQPAAFVANSMAASSNGITVPIAGYYRVAARISLSSNSESYQYIADGSYGVMEILVNSVSTSSSAIIGQQASATLFGEYGIVISDVLYLAGDSIVTIRVTVFASLNSGEIFLWGSLEGVDTYMSLALMSS